MGFSRLRVVFLLVVLAAAGGGVAAWWHYTHEPPTDRLVLYGNVDIRQVELAFNGTDRIAELYVEEGDRVRRGQLLGRLDTARLSAAVERAEAQVHAQEQVVARLEAGSRPQEIRKARADALAAEADADDANALYDRTVLAHEQGAATAQELDNARLSRQAALARLKAVGETLDLILAGPRIEDIASARAELRADQAQWRLQKQELTDATLYAPTDAVVQQRVLEPGEMASPQRPVFTLAVLDPLWVRTYVPETDLGKLRPGMSAEVRTDSFPDAVYAGWVGYISPTAEFTPKAVQTPEVRTSLVYQVRVFVHDPNRQLRLGMPATVTVRLDQPLEPNRPAGSPARDANGG